MSFTMVIILHQSTNTVRPSAWIGNVRWNDSSGIKDSQLKSQQESVGKSHSEVKVRKTDSRHLSGRADHSLEQRLKLCLALPCQLTDDNFGFSNFSTNSLQRSLQRVLCPAKKTIADTVVRFLASQFPQLSTVRPFHQSAKNSSSPRFEPAACAQRPAATQLPGKTHIFFSKRLPHSATSPAWQLNSAAQPQSRPARLFFSSFFFCQPQQRGFHALSHGAGIQRADILGLVIKSSVACAHEPCIDGQRRSFARRLDGRL
ncbi:hypothetical protein V8C44DRAFT_1809 [Trichoderma aethiopicum]